MMKGQLTLEPMPTLSAELAYAMCFGVCPVKTPYLWKTRTNKETS